MKFSKTFKNNLASAQMEYKATLAEIKRVEEIEKECKTLALEKNIFVEEESKIRILESWKDFLMSEKDFIEYCKLVHAERIVRGLKVENYNTTADAELKKTLKEKEKNLFTLGLETIPTGLKADIKKAFDNYKLKKEALELMSKLDVATLY